VRHQLGEPAVTIHVYSPRRDWVGQYRLGDDGGQIGRRYRRQDEIGTPFAFTIDEQTLEDDTVTIRDRDSLAQERLSIGRVREHLLDKLAAPWQSPKAD
jgi:glycyl-tRNA synthetase